MTDLETTAGSGQGAISIDRDSRIVIVGDVRAPLDREQLRLAGEHMLKVFAGNLDRDVVIDLHQAHYLDVATLTVLIGIARRCSAAGHQLVLDGASEELAQLLAVTRIDQVIGRYGGRVQRRPAA